MRQCQPTRWAAPPSRPWPSVRRRRHPRRRRWAIGPQSASSSPTSLRRGSMAPTPRRRRTASTQAPRNAPRSRCLRRWEQALATASVGPPTPPPRRRVPASSTRCLPSAPHATRRYGAARRSGRPMGRRQLRSHRCSSRHSSVAVPSPPRNGHRTAPLPGPPSRRCRSRRVRRPRGSQQLHRRRTWLAKHDHSTTWRSGTACPMRPSARLRCSVPRRRTCTVRKPRSLRSPAPITTPQATPPSAGPKRRRPRCCPTSSAAPGPTSAA